MALVRSCFSGALNHALKMESLTMSSVGWCSDSLGACKLGGDNLGSSTTIRSFSTGLKCALAFAVIGFASSNVSADTLHCSLEIDDKARAACFETNPQQRYEQRRSGWPIFNIRSYASGNPTASATRIAEEQYTNHARASYRRQVK